MQVVVLVAVVGHLDEVLDHHSSLRWSLTLKDLSGNPGGHLSVKKERGPK